LTGIKLSIYCIGIIKSKDNAKSPIRYDLVVSFDVGLFLMKKKITDSNYGTIINLSKFF
jgi:hypothetical protein